MQGREQTELPIEQKLSGKGLPVQAISGIKTMFRLWTKKVWNFVLEAKDLKPTAVAGYKIRRMFRQKSNDNAATNTAASQQAQPAAQVIRIPKEVKDERFFLEKIK